MSTDDRDPIDEAIRATDPLELERRKVTELEHALKARDTFIVQLEKELGILSRLGEDRDGPPTWLKSPKPIKRGAHRATPWLFLSDLHLDEVVRADELHGTNAYDRDIARRRLEETARKFIQIVRDYWTGLTYDGIVLPLGGDIFSGDIHEELRETNADTILGSLDYWLEQLAAVIHLIADEFGAVHVPVVVGNHGRTTRKPRAKLRARDNFDWFLGRALARVFQHDDRVTFDVSESADAMVVNYGRRTCITHGDQATGGAGIGGIWPPIKRLHARKLAHYSEVGLPFELLVMGHWHQLTYGPEFIVNGSLKGFDEYAFTSNFSYEPPAQAAWLMTPEHGKTWTAPILPADPVAEGWAEAPA